MVVTVTSPDDVVTEETPDLTPDITPCEKDKDYIIQVFKHPGLDSVAIENTQDQSVEVFTWEEITEGGETRLEKTYQKLTSEEFSRSSYSFEGYTIQSKCCCIGSVG